MSWGEHIAVESYKVKYEREHEENGELRRQIKDMASTILKRNKEIETLKRMLDKLKERKK